MTGVIQRCLGASLSASFRTGRHKCLIPDVNSILFGLKMLSCPLYVTQMTLDTYLGAIKCPMVVDVYLTPTAKKMPKVGIITACCPPPILGMLVLFERKGTILYLRAIPRSTILLVMFTSPGKYDH